MKLLRSSFLLFILVLISTSSLVFAQGRGWRGGGGEGRGGGFRGDGDRWHGGGFFGGGVVINGPGYYDPPYPYYYGGNPYSYSNLDGPVYYATRVEPSSSVAFPVQEELARRGYYRGPVDGVVGPGTRSAISAYQRRHGLEVNGVIDTPLLRSLRI